MVWEFFLLIRKKASVILSCQILDEPTSAIDPLEETWLYQKFAEMAEGRTAFIVTHRIGLTKIADRIMVMDWGRLVQTGTYEELEKEEGMFREMLQAQSFRSLYWGMGTRMMSSAIHPLQGKGSGYTFWPLSR